MTGGIAQKVNDPHGSPSEAAASYDRLNRQLVSVSLKISFFADLLCFYLP